MTYVNFNKPEYRTETIDISKAVDDINGAMKYTLAHDDSSKNDAVIRINEATRDDKYFNQKAAVVFLRTLEKLSPMPGREKSNYDHFFKLCKEKLTSLKEFFDSSDETYEIFDIFLETELIQNF